MKIAILGADGLLGQACRRELADAVPLGHAAADLTKPMELRRVLEAMRPTVVVNCAGYTQVDRAEAEPAAAFAVNTIGVRDLALMCRDLDCTLVHVSTDYVFGLDRARTLPYDECALPGPINVYGNSKLAGEQFVRGLCAKHFVLRTCGLYGAGASSSFVAALRRKASAGVPIRVVNDQVCTPTAACDVAQAIAELLTSQAYGLYHVTNAGACSWFEFAQAFFALCRVAAPLVAIGSDAYGAAARRPRYSVLDGGTWARAGFTRLRPWREALESYCTVEPACRDG